MTHKSIRISGPARVEGDGSLLVRARDGRITDVKLSIYEPLRFFEALLRGRSHTEPDARMPTTPAGAAPAPSGRPRSPARTVR
jgi:coenzyme F420-reducing hydrogenase alpha subunit